MEDRLRQNMKLGYVGFVVITYDFHKGRVSFGEVFMMKIRVAWCMYGRQGCVGNPQVDTFFWVAEYFWVVQTHHRKFAKYTSSSCISLSTGVAMFEASDALTGPVCC